MLEGEHDTIWENEGISLKSIEKKMSTQSSESNNNRIAKNTLLLYFRMLLIMVMTLFASRVVLDKSGVTDCGICNAVG